jgi:hypothetical protein
VVGGKPWLGAAGLGPTAREVCPARRGLAKAGV